MSSSKVFFRGLYAYSIHARDNSGVIEYEEFFNSIATLPGVERQIKVGNDFVAISVMDSIEGGWVLRFVTGREGMPQLTYDPTTGQELYDDLDGRMAISGSWVVLKPASRFVVVERNRPGVPVLLMAQALSNLGRDLLGSKALVVDLNPVPSQSLAMELNRFERIRQASLVISRPNFSWSDDANVLVMNYADDSDARSVEVVLSADTGESLSKSGGIIADIRRMIAHPIGAIRELKWTGRREGESKEVSVSLSKHQERSFARILVGTSPKSERDSIVNASENLLSKLEQRSGENG
ncbi:MAG: hypothetical protein Q8L08_04435 [Candidatus Nanopelagicaceae bacterium]|nr:hypothetical protein [Candidatus Nanopelagicaceae bacterium]